MHPTSHFQPLDTNKSFTNSAHSRFESGSKAQLFKQSIQSIMPSKKFTNKLRLARKLCPLNMFCEGGTTYLCCYEAFLASILGTRPVGVVSLTVCTPSIFLQSISHNTSHILKFKQYVPSIISIAVIKTTLQEWSFNLNATFCWFPKCCSKSSLL